MFAFPGTAAGLRAVMGTQGSKKLLFCAAPTQL